MALNKNSNFDWPEKWGSLHSNLNIAKFCPKNGGIIDIFLIL